jgi:hypothetical protein
MIVSYFSLSDQEVKHDKIGNQLWKEIRMTLGISRGHTACGKIIRLKYLE